MTNARGYLTLPMTPRTVRSHGAIGANRVLLEQINVGHPKARCLPRHCNFLIAHLVFRWRSSPVSPSAHLGFRTTTTLRRLLHTGELSAYVRLGPDLRATYLDMAPKGRPTLRQHVQAHTSCRGKSPLYGADYESWPKPNGICTDVANSYLDLTRWGHHRGRRCSG